MSASMVSMIASLGKIFPPPHAPRPDLVLRGQPGILVYDPHSLLLLLEPELGAEGEVSQVPKSSLSVVNEFWPHKPKFSYLTIE